VRIQGARTLRKPARAYRSNGSNPSGGHVSPEAWPFTVCMFLADFGGNRRRLGVGLKENESVRKRTEWVLSQASNPGILVGVAGLLGARNP
jgi:hypothetical protein